MCITIYYRKWHAWGSMLLKHGLTLPFALALISAFATSSWRTPNLESKLVCLWGCQLHPSLLPLLHWRHWMMSELRQGGQSLNVPRNGQSSLLSLLILMGRLWQSLSLSLKGDSLLSCVLLLHEESHLNASWTLTSRQHFLHTLPHPSTILTPQRPSTKSMFPVLMLRVQLNSSSVSNWCLDTQVWH